MTEYIEPDICKPKRKRSEPYLLHNVTILLLYFAAVIPHAVRYEIFANNHSIPYFLLQLLSNQLLLFIVLLTVMILIPMFVLYRKKSETTIAIVLALSFVFYCSLVTQGSSQYFRIYLLGEEKWRDICWNLAEEFTHQYFVYQCDELCQLVEKGIEPDTCIQAGPAISNN